MGSRLSEFNESGKMGGRPMNGLLIAILLAALPVIVAATVIINRDRGSDAAPVAAESSVGLFNYEAAADLSAMRWRAVAEFYLKNGLLTRSAPVFSSDIVRFTTAPGWEQARANDAARMELDTAESLAVPTWGPEQEYELLLREKAYLRSSAAPRVDPAGSSESGADRAAEIDAYYTERYWKMAGAKDEQPAAPEPDNIRQYQQQIHGR